MTEFGASSMLLAVVWVPCVGPFLSSILTLVATNGEMAGGALLLALYSAGLAIPMLIVGYSSHLIQNRIKGVLKHDTALRLLTGGILVAYGLYSLVAGNTAF